MLVPAVAAADVSQTSSRASRLGVGFIQNAFVVWAAWRGKHRSGEGMPKGVFWDCPLVKRGGNVLVAFSSHFLWR